MSETALNSIIGVVLSLLVSVVKFAYKKATGNEMSAVTARYLTFLLCFLAGTGMVVYQGSMAPPPSDPVQFAAWVGIAYGIILASATTFYGLFSSAETRLIARKG